MRAACSRNVWKYPAFIFLFKSHTLRWDADGPGFTIHVFTIIRFYRVKHVTYVLKWDLNCLVLLRMGGLNSLLLQGISTWAIEWNAFYLYWLCFAQTVVNIKAIPSTANMKTAEWQITTLIIVSINISSPLWFKGPEQNQQDMEPANH